MVPVIVTLVPPAVGIADAPATELIEGPTYDAVPEDAALVWPPTVTFHTKLLPTPATLVH